MIVVNTCGFIGEAKQESIDAILEMARHKEAGTCKRLVVAGCLSQRYPRELADEMPEVDHFIGTDEVGDIAGAIGGQWRASTSPRSRVFSTTIWRCLYGDAHRVREDRRGVRPSVRVLHHPQAASGPQRSRLPDSVVREAEALAAAGTKGICLVAQDLTTYGTDLPGAGAPGAATLESLLAELARVEGLRSIRLHYAYPTACTDGLLDVMAREARVAKYLDVPVQHIDSGVLKSMRRGYGERAVRDLCARVRARVPGATLRTTFIVGHPGETDEAFARLCDFVREAELDRVGVFNYSKEEGTVARCCPAGCRRRDRRPPRSCCASSARSRSASCARCAARRSTCWSRGRPTSPSIC